MSNKDLIETVKSQQLEINKLRKEVNLVRQKLTRAVAQGFKV